MNALTKRFVDDYFNRRREVYDKLYWYKNLPTSKDVADELETAGNLDKVIDENTDQYEICYLMREGNEFKVFILDKFGELNLDTFSTLKQAVQKKFEVILQAIYSSNR